MLDRLSWPLSHPARPNGSTPIQVIRPARHRNDLLQRSIVPKIWKKMWRIVFVRDNLTFLQHSPEIHARRECASRVPPDPRETVMLRLLCSTVSVVALLVLVSPRLRGEDLLPAEYSIEDVVDHYIDEKLKDAGVTPTPTADDANLVRRLTLDLAGRIPTAAEVGALRRVDRPGQAGRTRRSPDGVARVRPAPGRRARRDDDGRRPGSLRDYLVQAVAENRPWDRIFRELMVPDRPDPTRKGPAEFIKERVKDLDRLTSDVSSTFFGVNISCAKCHDHPRVDDWKQDHFYGMKSFLDRTYPWQRQRLPRRTRLRHRQVPDDRRGEERQAKFMFLTGSTVDVPDVTEPPKPSRRRRRAARRGRNEEPPPPPSFSARARLVEVAFEPGERDFFARSIVNRLWYRFYGQGLVMPLDQMHSANPPSHPELLQWLARDLVEHRYDIRRLVRGLVLSRAYARSSRWDGDEPAPQPLFAVAAPRPLTPMQLATSMRLAATAPSQLPGRDQARGA